MKKIIYLFAILLTSLSTQAQFINYQGVARDNAGNILINQPIALQLSVLSGIAVGTAVYVETHATTTDAYGLFTLQIGQGTIVSGVFNDIAWSSTSFFLRVEIDPTGGTNYVLAGTTQFAAVPYSLHAKTADNGFSGNYNDLTNQPVLFDGAFNSLTGKPTILAGYGITDAMNTSHAANSISTTNITNWDAAFGWGNHAGLYRPITYVPTWGEVTGKPVFATVATSGSYNDLANLPVLFNGTWLSLTGKPTTLSGYGITDAMNTSHAANGITTTNITNWNTAFAWGNHAGLYRPISYVPAWGEVTGKPVFATVATSGSYNDLANLPVLFNGTWLSLTGKPTTLAGYGITDAMNTNHAANAITTTNITNWNTAFAWGNHAGLYRPIGYVPAWGEITANPFSFSAVANNQLLKYNTTSGKWENWTPNYLISFTETDPIFGAWDKSSGIVIASSQVSNFEAAVTNTPAVLANTAKNSYPTADAAKLAGIAAGAEVNVNTDWNASSGDSQLLNKPNLATVATTGSYTNLINKPTPWDSTWASIKNKPTGTNPGDMLYWNGTTWVNIPASTTNGQSLTFCNGVPTWGPCIDFAVLMTTAATSITGFTATSGGNVTNNGGTTVTSRGICLATTINPDIYDITVISGSGTGSFSTNITGLSPNTTYYVRAFATNSAGTAYGNEIIFTTLNIPTLTTTAITSISYFSAISGGNISNDGGTAVISRGICFSNTINPTIANNILSCGTGTGSFTANLTGLMPSTTYYVRAYATNSGGTAYGNELNFTTPAWSCGLSYSVNHLVSSGVAPVDKSTTYGTVNNISGEPTKCWITKNLGATNQATAANDATEEAAGWYWQFNKKQGYKHDGSSRTPATTWVSSINESSDWIAANDPCTIELGYGWRLPTKSEWENVDAGNSWTNWTGPFNSSLKLHGQGVLNNSTGNIFARGSSGSQWSNTQASTTTAWRLVIDSVNSRVDNTESKSYGFSIRCLRE